MRGEADDRLDWRLFALALLLAVALLAARAFWHAGTVPLLGDTDDAMRLAVVRDLLAGQGWYDHMQYRLNTPFGAEIHWSRLADLPVAALLLLFRPLVGAQAWVVAAWAWPLLLLVPLLWLSARIALRLGGRETLLPALLLPVFSLVTLGEFAPGRIDHHNLQIVLLLLLTWCSIEALARPWAAVGAGLTAATALAIGIEGLPGVAAAILAFGLAWVFRPARAVALRRFGLAFALGTAAHLLLALPPARWFEPACDALSATYAAAALGVGLAFTLLSLLPLAGRSAALRLALGVGAGVLLLLALALAFPTCLGGPYAALDPWLQEHWIDRIVEAVPLWRSFLDDPAYATAIALPPLLALAVAGWRLRHRAPDTGAWLVYGAFLLLAVLVMLAQVRGARMAASLAAPAGAWLIVAARRRYLAAPRLARAAGLLAAWIGFAGIALLVVVRGALLLPADAGTAAAATPERQQCLLPSAFDALAELPPQRLMAPIDLGSHLLAFTPHAVVAAPYHRNQQGVRDAFVFFGGPIAEARAILERRGIDLVVTCPALPELHTAGAAANSFIALSAAGELPVWLRERDNPGSPLRVFTVSPSEPPPER